MSAEPDLRARFTPLERASVARRRIVVVLGPLLWLVAASLVGIVLDRGTAVEVGLVVTFAAFVVSLCVSALARRSRLREERDERDV